MSRYRSKKWYAILLLAAVGAACLGVAAGCAEPAEEPPAPIENTPVQQQLSSPENFRMEDGVLLWDEVENAEWYTLEVNGDQLQTRFLDFEVADWDMTVTVEARVRAEGNDSYAASAWAEFTYLGETPTAALSYTLLDDGSGYEVSRRGGKYSGFSGLEGRVVIPDEYNGLPVKRIADYAFCIDTLFENIETGAYCNTVTTSVRLPAQLEEIGASAFACCIALEEVVIPDSVTVLEEACFNRCINLTTVTFPANLEVIGCTAFTDCRSLNSPLVLPASISAIGEYAFCNCTELKEVEFLGIPEQMGWKVFDETGWLADLMAEQGDYVELCEGLLYAYYGDDTELVVPDRYRYIAGGAFYANEQLVSVTLPQDAKLLGGYIFFCCSSLTEVVLPEGIETIPDSMFHTCTALEAIDIPDSVTEIGKAAFYNCQFTEVTLPAGLKVIGRNGFHACPLQSIALPEGLEVLGAVALLGTRLTELYIPASVKEIGNYVIGKYSTGVEAVYYGGSEAQWNEIAIDENNYDLLSRPRYYYCEGEPALNEDGTAYLGNYWHYDANGNITIWSKESEE